MTKATWNGRVLAESDRTVDVEGNTYFPPDSLAQELLEKSSKTSVCAWKGTANYYHLVVDGERNEDAAWFYTDPKPEAGEIRGHVAFWKGVQIS